MAAFRSRSVKLNLLPLLSLLLFFQPITSFEISYNPQPEQYWPFSLDDCQNLAAANQLARWKQTYKLCMTLFFNKPRDLPDQSHPLQGVTMTTDTRFQGVADINTDVMPVMTLKRLDDTFDTDDADNIFIKDSSQRDVNDDNDDDTIDDGQWTKRGPQQKKWSSLISTVLRSRRQHSLSINSALVSLADMLMAQDFSRQKARQRMFRQQLLGLGR